MDNIGSPSTTRVPMAAYDRLSILIHWAIFVLVVTVCTLGFLFYKLDYRTSQAYASYYYWHRSLGEIIFVLTIFSVFRRTTRTPPPEFPDVPWRATVARVTKSLLLVLLILVPAFKLWRGAYGTMGWTFFAWHIPGIWPPNEPLGRFLTAAHYYSALALIFLSALHSLAAIWHQFVKRDSLLKRMSPL
ncbi:cytochrome b [Paraburkholderia sartisoli]|uniref:Cytochrome b561 n=1 Tax=Paraburkholderia sartisoli TaxID=83784 RepID=A0A1H4D1Q0_9BURK|nr:cytochrome b/b6 domain-containing protein [Paraburkholderia sartisoli]SEA66359.1 cytochrome b561 [Paraburkholderia sartisoli]